MLPSVFAKIMSPAADSVGGNGVARPLQMPRSVDTMTVTMTWSHSKAVENKALFPHLVEDQSSRGLDRSMHREFDKLRDEAVESGRGKPLVRIAAYLLAISSINQQEGRPVDIVGDDFECGFVAECLGFEIDELAMHLVELSRRGLIELCPLRGLRLRDLDGLVKLGETG